MGQMPAADDWSYLRRVTTWQEAERCAAAWIRVMGHPDARVTPSGADGGIDVLAGRAAAQVKFQVGTKTSRPQIQQLAGAAGREGVDLFYFSLAGYTAEALNWATQAGIATFQLEVTGDITPLNEPARTAIRMLSGRPAWASNHVVGTTTSHGIDRSRKPSKPGVWRRTSVWFGRLFRTVAWEAKGAAGPEPLGEQLMSGVALAGSGVGFLLVGIVGAIVMIGETVAPSDPTGTSPAESIAGAVFYAAVALFGAWCSWLGRRRQARLSPQATAPPRNAPPGLQFRGENDGGPQS